MNEQEKLFYQELGFIIKERRLANGFSLENLSNETLKLTKSSMSLVENGGQRINVYQLKVLDEFLGEIISNIPTTAAAGELKDKQKKILEVKSKIKELKDSLK